MPFTIRFLSIALVTLISSFGYCQSGDIDLTPGKLDAVEFSFRLDNVKLESDCLYGVQSKLVVGESSLVVLITKEIESLKTHGTWNDIEQRYDLNEVRDLDIVLKEFIKSKVLVMEPQIAQSISECSGN